MGGKGKSSSTSKQGPKGFTPVSGGSDGKDKKKAKAAEADKTASSTSGKGTAGGKKEGGGLHPCIKMYGVCYNKEYCRFAKFPEDVCVSRLYHPNEKCPFQPKCKAENHSMHPDDPRYQNDLIWADSHPCLRLHGKCAQGNSCPYINFPRGTCVDHLKGQCVGKRKQCSLLHLEPNDPRYVRVEERPHKKAAKESTSAAAKDSSSGSAAKKASGKDAAPTKKAATVAAEKEDTSRTTHPCLRKFKKCISGDECLFANFPIDCCLDYLKGRCEHSTDKCPNGQHIEACDPKYVKTHPCMRVHKDGCISGEDCFFSNFPYNTCLDVLKGRECTSEDCKQIHSIDRHDPRFIKTHPCKLYFKDGGCNLGDEHCPFAKFPINCCLDVLKGRECRYGESCKKNHDVDPYDERFVKRHPCLHFFSDGCFTGEYCMYKNFPVICCFDFLRFGKCDRKDCQEPHLSQDDPRFQNPAIYSGKHPCLLHYEDGRCPDGEDCEFANFPIGACMKHLKGNCPPNKHCGWKHIDRGDPRYRRATGTTPKKGAGSSDAFSASLPELGGTATPSVPVAARGSWAATAASKPAAEKGNVAPPTDAFPALQESKPILAPPTQDLKSAEKKVSQPSTPAKAPVAAIESEESEEPEEEDETYPDDSAASSWIQNFADLLAGKEAAEAHSGDFSSTLSGSFARLQDVKIRVGQQLTEPIRLALAHWIYSSGKIADGVFWCYYTYNTSGECVSACRPGRPAPCPEGEDCPAGIDRRFLANREAFLKFEKTYDILHMLWSLSQASFSGGMNSAAAFENIQRLAISVRELLLETWHTDPAASLRTFALACDGKVENYISDTFNRCSRLLKDGAALVTALVETIREEGTKEATCTANVIQAYTSEGDMSWLNYCLDELRVIWQFAAENRTPQHTLSTLDAASMPSEAVSFVYGLGRHLCSTNVDLSPMERISEDEKKQLVELNGDPTTAPAVLVNTCADQKQIFPDPGMQTPLGMLLHIEEVFGFALVQLLCSWLCLSESVRDRVQAADEDDEITCLVWDTNVEGGGSREKWADFNNADDVEDVLLNQNKDADNLFKATCSLLGFNRRHSKWSTWTRYTGPKWVEICRGYATNQIITTEFDVKAYCEYRSNCITLIKEELAQALDINSKKLNCTKAALLNERTFTRSSFQKNKVDMLILNRRTSLAEKSRRLGELVQGLNQVAEDPTTEFVRKLINVRVNHMKSSGELGISIPRLAATAAPPTLLDPSKLTTTAAAADAAPLDFNASAAASEPESPFVVQSSPTAIAAPELLSMFASSMTPTSGAGPAAAPSAPPPAPPASFLPDPFGGSASATSAPAPPAVAADDDGGLFGMPGGITFNFMDGGGSSSAPAPPPPLLGGGVGGTGQPLLGSPMTAPPAADPVFGGGFIVSSAPAPPPPPPQVNYDYVIRTETVREIYSQYFNWRNVLVAILEGNQDAVEAVCTKAGIDFYGDSQSLSSRHHLTVEDVRKFHSQYPNNWRQVLDAASEPGSEDTIKNLIKYSGVLLQKRHGRL